MGRDGQRRYRRMEPLEVSIHAPAWGATSGLLHRSASRCCFNPRARMGRDPQIRVTRQPCCQFQSTRPHGARRPTFVGKTGEELFQSTRPHGARLARVSWGRQSRRFQSTRPHGARHGHPGLGHVAGLVSIHAPAWGATVPVRQVGRQVSFQSTRPHGARRAHGGERGGQELVSIHAPAWGATPEPGPLQPPKRRFNPRARMGRDTGSSSARRSDGVSIHAPAWGATLDWLKLNAGG